MYNYTIVSLPKRLWHQKYVHLSLRNKSTNNINQSLNHMALTSLYICQFLSNSTHIKALGRYLAICLSFSRRGVTRSLINGPPTKSKNIVSTHTSLVKFQWYLWSQKSALQKKFTLSGKQRPHNLNTTYKKAEDWIWYLGCTIRTIWEGILAAIMT